MSTAQVESALVEHPGVAEAAVVACPHPVKGECLYCFITPMEGAHVDDRVRTELRNLVREKIAPFASPDFIQVSLQFHYLEKRKGTENAVSFEELCDH